MYDVDQALITKVLEEEDMGLLLRHRITPDYIGEENDESRQVLAWIFDRYEKRGRVPSISLLQQQFPDWEPVDTEDSFEMVLDAVKEKKLYAQLSLAVKRVASEARESPIEALKTLQDEASKLGLDFSEGVAEDITKSGKAVKRHYRLLKKTGGLLGMPWPWKELTDVTGGIRKGSFNAFYGPPGTYKSWLLINVGDFAHQEFDARPILFPGEMPVEDIRVRWAAGRAKVDWKKFQKGKLSPKEEKRFFEAIDSYEDDPPFIVDDLQSTGAEAIMEIDSKCKSYNRNLVLIDGLAFVTDDEDWKDWNKLLKGLKRWAKTSSIPIVSTHHASKARKTAKPGEVDATDIALGDALFRHVDVLIRLWRSEQMRDNKEVGVNTKKVREGEDTAFYINARPAFDFSFKCGAKGGGTTTVPTEEDDGFST